MANLCILLPGRALIAAAGAQSSQEQAPTRINDWSPDSLYQILSSQNPEASDNLYRAAFAEGPAVVPQLRAALKDDRTAEFAAQSLAFIGGEKAHAILAGLVNDPRDLNLRRFYYGSLGEFDDPASAQILLNVVNGADREPDRTVVEAAILALSVHSDPRLAAKLNQMEKGVKDYVLQDDIETAATVIDLRAKYLSTPEGKAANQSARQAIRTYFIPALGAPPEEDLSGQPPPSVDIKVQELTYSPGKTRALAHVVFETPEALAHYQIVLQKKQGAWTAVSAWLGQELEKPHPSPQNTEPQ